MIGHVVSSSKEMGLFLMTWIFLFSLLFKVQGTDVTDGNSTNPRPDEYPHVNTYLANMLQVFRNSIGDRQPPGYDFWNSKVDSEPTLSYTMISYSWLLWIGNTVFMLLIVINFLITTVQRSYEKVSKNNLCVLYNTRCEFNVESTLLQECLKKKANIEIASILTLSATISDSEVVNKYQQLLRPIQHFIDKEMTTLKDEVRKGDKENKDKLAEHDKTVKVEITNVKNQVTGVKDDVSIIKGKIEEILILIRE